MKQRVEEYERDEFEFLESCRLRLLGALPRATPENLTQRILVYLVYGTDTETEELDAWQRRTWEQPGPYRPFASSVGGGRSH